MLIHIVIQHHVAGAHGVQQAGTIDLRGGADEKRNGDVIAHVVLQQLLHGALERFIIKGRFGGDLNAAAFAHAAKPPSKTFVAITVCKMQENQNRAAKYTADNAYKRKR